MTLDEYFAFNIRSVLTDSKDSIDDQLTYSDFDQKCQAYMDNMTDLETLESLRSKYTIYGTSNELAENYADLMKRHGCTLTSESLDNAIAKLKFVTNAALEQLCESSKVVASTESLRPKAIMKYLEEIKQLAATYDAVKPVPSEADAKLRTLKGFGVDCRTYITRLSQLKAAIANVTNNVTKMPADLAQLWQKLNSGNCLQNLGFSLKDDSVWRMSNIRKPSMDPYYNKIIYGDNGWTSETVINRRDSLIRLLQSSIDFTNLKKNITSGTIGNDIRLGPTFDLGSGSIGVGFSLSPRAVATTSMQTAVIGCLLDIEAILARQWIYMMKHIVNK